MPCNQACSGDISHVGISGTVDQQSSLVRLVKFRVESFHGVAGGLQFLSAHGAVKHTSRCKVFKESLKNCVQGCHCASEDKSIGGKCSTTRINDMSVYGITNHNK